MATRQSERWELGSVVRLDPETCEGLVRLDEHPCKAELRFVRSKIALDERYIGDIIVGAQFFCEIKLDHSGAPILETMFPRDIMEFDGVITKIRRLEGVAEVTPELLATPILFTRTHLDCPDHFQRLRVGDKVRIEMQFYNLVAKQKPPRATRVLPSTEIPGEPEIPLRPALRRSNSLSHRQLDFTADLFDYYETPPGSMGPIHSGFEDPYQTTRASHGYRTFEPGVPSLSCNHRSRSLFLPPPPPVFPMQGHGQLTPMPPVTGWLRRASLMPPAGPVRLPPFYRDFCPRRSPSFHQAGYPIPPQTYASTLPGHPLETECHQSRGEYLRGILEHCDGSLGAGDDSDVVLELTVDELRRLMLDAGPRSRSRDHDQ